MPCRWNRCWGLEADVVGSEATVLHPFAIVHLRAHLIQLLVHRKRELNPGPQVQAEEDHRTPSEVHETTQTNISGKH